MTKHEVHHVEIKEVFNYNNSGYNLVAIILKQSNQIITRNGSPPNITNHWNRYYNNNIYFI